jgi:ribulose-phosphate 3-epimerase
MTVKSFIIAPSILSADFLHLADQIRSVEEAGADWLHLDVMDGHFVPNLSMGPFIVEAVRKATRMPLDVHLMVKEPENLFASFAEAGADHLTVHVEACEHILDTLGQIHSLGLKAGVSLRPVTPVSSITTLLPHVEGVLVMSVDPGYAGKKFLPGAIERIAQIRQELDKLGSAAWLAVDGGINTQSLPLAVKAGADVFIAASAIFQNPDGIAAAIRSFRKILV